MTSATAGFPGSKDLAGLWCELGLLPAQSLWIGHLLLHRIEAPVEVEQASGLDPLFSAALRALELGEPATLVALDQRLPIGTGLLVQHMRQLAGSGLIEPAAPNAWKLSSAGRAALLSRAGPRRQVERRTFHFLEVGAGKPPVFVPIAAGWSTPVNDPDEWHFSLEVLTDCLAHDRVRKATQGFPTDVAELHDLASAAAAMSDPAASPGPVIDRAEALTVALIADQGCTWHALDARSWRRLTPDPVVRLAAEHAAVEALHQQMPALPAGAERRAWVDWARKRGLSERDVQACQVSLEKSILHVRPAAALTPRWQRLPLEEEGCLLIGDGPLRRAARINIVTGPANQRLR